MSGDGSRTFMRNRRDCPPTGWQGQLALLLLAGYLLLLAAAARDSRLPATLGIIASYEATTGNWLVADVKPASLAMSKGVRPGDILVEVDGQAPPGDVTAGRAAVERAGQLKSRRPVTGEEVQVGEVGRKVRTLHRMPYFLISIVFFAVGAVAFVWGR